MLLLSKPLAFSHKKTICALLALASTTARSFPSPRNSAAARTMASSCQASSLEIVQVPCLSDNYGYLIHDPATGSTAVVDTPEAKPYQDEMAKRGWKLTHILNTHHHWDHTGANKELKTEGVQVVGPMNEKAKIPGIDAAVGAGDTVEFGSTKATVMDVGGHTKGHIAFYFPQDKSVFVGDSLFALGCGRMFEGTPTQFWTSLKGLRELPDDTVVYCAHEYTLSNGKFAMSVEPNNADLVARWKQIQGQRSRNEPTVPSMMGEEKKTNPFLRCDLSDEIRSNVGVTSGDSEADAFAKVRAAKDNFRG